MTAFMTAPAVIPVQPTCPGGQRAKGNQFPSTCKLCHKSHKTQVWLCFLILSFLSASTCAAPVIGIPEVLLCVKELKPFIEKSDAMLYTPSANGVDDKCKYMLLRCYIWELIVVISEEEINGFAAGSILFYNSTLSPQINDDCTPCEAYSLKNITIFLKRLQDFLQECNSDSTSHCTRN